MSGGDGAERRTPEPSVIINAFHGTAVRFDAFDTSRGGEVTGYHGADRGVFFAACEADCWSYADDEQREGRPPSC
jgi:hypothetical protein